LTAPPPSGKIAPHDQEGQAVQSYKLVLPEHLNHYGYLFGGYLLQWVDEAAYIAASLDYPQSNFVTVAMDRVEFHRSIRQGAILRFEVERQRIGTTSVRYRVEVFDGTAAQPVFSTQITFVGLGPDGTKCPLPK
jgi:acyl-CoA hydrolase